MMIAIESDDEQPVTQYEIDAVKADQCPRCHGALDDKYQCTACHYDALWIVQRPEYWA